MPRVTTNAKITAPASGHLMGRTIHQLELAPEAVDPWRQFLSGLLKPVVQTFFNQATRTRTQPTEQWFHVTGPLRNTTISVHTRRRKTYGRADNDRMQVPDLRKPLESLAAATADCRRAKQKKRDVAAQLAGNLYQTIGRPVDPPGPVGRQQSGCRIA
jgi:hypothetical protein